MPKNRFLTISNYIIKVTQVLLMNISIDSIFIIDMLCNGFFYFRTYMPCSSFYRNLSKIKRRYIYIFFIVRVTTSVPVICIIFNHMVFISQNNGGLGAPIWSVNKSLFLYHLLISRMLIIYGAAICQNDLFVLLF